jgi:DNA replication ATP-dependent helicase Dna2
VLAQIVKARVARGERVLVTACTHRAIHEALSAVSRALPGFERIAKVGTPVRDPGLPVDQYPSFEEVPFASEAGAYVIGATPFTARSQRLSGVDFDAVVIDEASQMTLPLAVMAMLSANCYVIIGDPRQLPPVVLSARPSEAVEHSLFRHLGRRREQVQLATTYRMNAALTQWVGERFYLGSLRSWPGARDRRLRVWTEDLPRWLQEVLDPAHSLVWIPTHTTSTRHYSREEAALLTQIVAALHQAGHPLADVGIVTPFRRQAREIRRRLRQSLEVPADLSDAIVIDTVERMQGQEREVICISTAASHAGFLEAIGEFLFLPQRLNVAVSRARTKVIVLASDALLSSAPSEDRLIDGLEHWSSLRESAHVVEA